MQFIEFLEDDRKGGTRTYWLPLDGNRAQIEKLRGLLAKARWTYEYKYVSNFPYRLGEVRAKSVVKQLVAGAVRYANGDTPFHIEVTGVFTCPDFLGEYAENLYKGGIKAFFTAAVTR